MRPAKRDIDDSVGSPLDCAHRYRRIGWGLRGTVRSNQTGEGASLLAEDHDLLAGKFGRRGGSLAPTGAAIARTKPEVYIQIGRYY